MLLQNIQDFISNILKNRPENWLNLTTHRLDIYNEALAKTEFLEKFGEIYQSKNTSQETLNALPTAYDYIRLGHPLSCILEWVIAKLNQVNSNNVISFASHTMPLIAILRENSLLNIKTTLYFKDKIPTDIDFTVLETIYGFNFSLKEIKSSKEIYSTEETSVFITYSEDIFNFEINPATDFIIKTNAKLGSILLINNEENNAYISKIQHVRRRETIAMTPVNSLASLESFANNSSVKTEIYNTKENKTNVLNSLKQITNTTIKPLVASSGLSMQYAIMMGCINDALTNHKGKAIKIVVPPNCYGGTNDQARRVAETLDFVEIVDLPVDGDNDMVKSTESVLETIAKQDAIPYIIAEIPTNPRVEVPDLEALKAILNKKRITKNGTTAIAPVFILDQTFCPNVHFLGESDTLSGIKAISYASGSKFPSGGKCTAGYCVANNKASKLMDYIQLHLNLCDNEATKLQYKILTEQLPSMTKRINDAYKNTREFVEYINLTLPDAKINFVSKDLAEQGFTPSVFSLDLPTKGNTNEEKEQHKRQLNHELINLMITKIPTESKYCVSYGQLKGCYWTIPATSTQGTTKENDKDYIARVAVSPNLDLETHKTVFLEFVNNHIIKK